MIKVKELFEGRSMGHALHPYLVHLPIGLFVLSFVLDFASQMFPDWSGLVPGAFHSMFLGVVSAVVASVPGLVDYTDIRDHHPAKRVASAHMILNLVVVASFCVNLFLRQSALEAVRTPLGPFFLSLAALVLLLISGYLGGHLVYGDGVGVGRHRRNRPAEERTLERHTDGTEAQSWSRTSEEILVPVPGTGRMQDGDRLRLSVDGQIILLVKHGDGFSAVQGFCPHRFGPLSEGRIENARIECPWHRSCFDLRSGKALEGPAKEDLKTWRVVASGDQIAVAVPLAGTGLVSGRPGCQKDD